MSQDSIDRNDVPIPKQITSPFLGVRGMKARGRCVIILVIGVSTVVPTPLITRCLRRPSPAAITVAVASRRTSARSNWLSKPRLEAPRSAATVTAAPKAGHVRAGRAAGADLDRTRKPTMPKKGAASSTSAPPSPASGRSANPATSGPTMPPTTLRAYADPAREGSPRAQRSTSNGVR
jgi:hypothetical protein